MPQTPERLKKRSEFKRVAGGRKWAAPGLVLQARPRPKDDPTTEREASQADTARVGFTVSKKVGNAVERNRVKRRLRALVADVLAPHAAEATDYVLIGRRAALSRPYAALGRDLEESLRGVGAWREAEERAES